jgi:hypothetical protein
VAENFFILFKHDVKLNQQFVTIQCHSNCMTLGALIRCCKTARLILANTKDFLHDINIIYPISVNIDSEKYKLQHCKGSNSCMVEQNDYCSVCVKVYFFC